MKQTLTLDSTQVSQYLECPSLWNYSSNESITLFTQQQEKEAMMMGTYGHWVLELFYKCLANGWDRQRAIQFAFEHSDDIDNQTCECGHGTECHDDIAGAACSHTAPNPDNDCKCGGWRPKPFELSLPKRIDVKNRLRDYFYKWQSNDFTPLSPEHVEVGFSESIFESTDRVYVLEGRIDLIGTLQGLPCIVDHKFQTREKNIYQRSIQFRNYSLVGRKPMMVINYIRLTKSVSDSTLARDIITFNPIELLYWKKRLISIYDKVFAARELGVFEQNESACKGQYGYNCEFTRLCEQSYNPELVQLVKQSQYKEKERWRPW